MHHTTAPGAARGARHRARVVALPLLILAALAGCTRDERAFAVDARELQVPIDDLDDPSNCSSTFRMVKAVADSELQALGVPPVVDTVDVCQNWTGTDYQVRMQKVGSSDRAVYGSLDESPVTVHDAGVYRTIESDGQMDDAKSVGTLSDFLQIDSTLTEAAQDDPYYTLRATYECTDPEGCSTMPSNTGPSGARISAARMAADDCVSIDDSPCSALQGARVPANGRSTAFGLSHAASATGQARAASAYARHGLRRRGVRALVDRATEIGKLNGRFRQFRRIRGDEETVVAIDEATELLVQEEVRSPRERVTRRYRWKRVEGGWVRDQVTEDAVDIEDGKELPSRSIITLSRIVLR